jgi:hypothetical protein
MLADEGQPQPQMLERPGSPRLNGSLSPDLTSGLRFLPIGDGETGSLPLKSGEVVVFPPPGPSPSSIPPVFRVLMGETGRLSGMLRRVGEMTVSLVVPWQDEEVMIARPAVEAVLQRPGESRVFLEPFESFQTERWSVVAGKPEIAPLPRTTPPRKGLRLSAGETAILHRLAEPLTAGRLELAFLDEGTVVPGHDWSFDLTFRGPSGRSTVHILLGWAEESLAVESLEGPSLAVQRLARSPGWHRLSVRFGPAQTEISVDGKELAHGKGPAGPLESIKLSTASSTSKTEGPAAYLDEVQIMRFAEPPASLEVDPSQDEVRLVVGDQLYGVLREATVDHVVIEVADRPVTLDWSEVSGVHLRRGASPGVPIEGPIVRLEWRTTPTDRDQDLDFAEGTVAAISNAAITLATPYAGLLSIPRDRLVRMRVLDVGWRLVLDPSAHHLGDNISTSPPRLDPPLPEGGTLERTFELTGDPGSPAMLVLDVLQVVGESSGSSPYSNLVAKGELRTYVSINGKRVDYLNHYIDDANETPERIRIPIPAGLLKVGKNTLFIEQTGIANDPNWLDDLGILQIAIQFPKKP